MSIFKNPFKKNSVSAEKQENDSPKFLSPSSRQPVDTQLDMGTPTIETGGSLFDGMDFGNDDITPETPSIPQDEVDLSGSELPSDLKFETTAPPPPPPPVSDSPVLLKEEPEEVIVPPASTPADLGASQKKKTRRAKLPGGVSAPITSRSNNSTPTPSATSSLETGPVRTSPTDSDFKENTPQVDIRESVEKLLVILGELEESRRVGEVAIESRVSQLTARCQLQERRGQLIKLISEAEEQEDFNTAERLNTELECVERELRECDVKTDLLDMWNGFYSQVMKGYKREAEKLQDMSGVRQDAADRLEQELR